MHETIAVVTSTHFALTHPVLLAVNGTNPFANIGAALLAIADAVKVPLSGVAFLIAGGAQAIHSPRASGMWISAVIATVTLFGATGIAAYLGANVT